MNQSNSVTSIDENFTIASPDVPLTSFLDDVLAGLSKNNKSLHCKYFYDERGSQLFDQICELEDYYPTRTEAQIMADNADAIAERIGAGAFLVEYGSGSSTKTRVLLDHLADLKAYMPVDISEDHLLQTAERLRAEHPGIEIHPIVADFTAGFDLPQMFDSSGPTIYFPGSTIGNLEQASAIELLGRIARQCGTEGGLLIGIDLEKDEEILQRAYDDSEGVTAAFNLNLLQRINRELDADFDITQFRHVALFNRDKCRIEIYIESLNDQTVRIGEAEFIFRRGERIFTEYSHKYRIEQFESMADQAGLSLDAAWTDERGYFAVLHLSAGQSES